VPPSVPPIGAPPTDVPTPGTVVEPAPPGAAGVPPCDVPPSESGWPGVVVGFALVMVLDAPGVVGDATPPGGVVIDGAGTVDALGAGM
jgi:hypothetical protein